MPVDALSRACRQLLATLSLPVAPEGADSPRARDLLAAAVAPFAAPGTGRIPCACVVAESIERVLRELWPVGAGNSRRALLTLLCSQALTAAEEAARAA
ncbi:hypothetical protein MNEG_5487, partial [Monoraphidium neglectum]